MQVALQAAHFSGSMATRSVHCSKPCRAVGTDKRTTGGKGELLPGTEGGTRGKPWRLLPPRQHITHVMQQLTQLVRNLVRKYKLHLVEKGCLHVLNQARNKDAATWKGGGGSLCLMQAGQRHVQEPTLRFCMHPSHQACYRHWLLCCTQQQGSQKPSCCSAAGR